MNEALFRTHLASEDLDWLPRRFAAIRWTVTGAVWTGVGAVVAAIMWGPYDPWVLKSVPFMAGGGYLAGDWLARSVLRSRLRKLAHGALDLTRLPAEPDGELVHVEGRVQVRKPLAPFIDTRRATYRRVVYRVGRYRLVHEAAEDFWLTTDDSEPVLVEVERARVLALDNALTEYPGHDPIAMLLATLPLPEGYEHAFEELHHNRARGWPLPSVKASEVLIGDNDRVEVVGYKSRTVDATVATGPKRDTPLRVTLHGGKKLPLIISPMA